MNIVVHRIGHVYIVDTHVYSKECVTHCAKYAHYQQNTAKWNVNSALHIDASRHNYLLTQNRLFGAIHGTHTLSRRGLLKTADI